MLKKLKSLILDDTVYIAFLLVFVGIGSFGLGKMSVTTTSKTNSSFGSPVSLMGNVVSTAATTSIPDPLPSAPAALIMAAPRVITADQTNIAPAQNFVASKAGTKYHAVTCPGAKNIKETNKIFFSTIAEAEAAGYTRAANCPLR